MRIIRSATNSQPRMARLMRAWTTLAISLALTCAASAQTTIYVDVNNCPTPGTGSLVDPFCSIQDAIDASVDTDTIEVAPGTYHEAIDFIGKAITLRSADGPATTIIDATTVPDLGSGVTVVRCVNGETAATVLDGFTITGGTGDTSVFVEPIGGGMLNSYPASPTVTNCTFSRNTADFGGGMCNISASPIVTNCSFSENTAVRSGGGMFNYLESYPVIKNSTFRGNIAQVGGGMLNAVLGEGLSVTDCSFIGNSAIDNTNTFGLGGAIYIGGTNPPITNCTFSGNTARLGGGIYLYKFASPKITNCTFSGNLAVTGAGLYNAHSSNPTLTNCILSAC